MINKESQLKSNTEKMNYYKEFRIKPEDNVRLKDFDPGFADKHENKKSALLKIEKLRKQMDELAV